MDKLDKYPIASHPASATRSSKNGRVSDLDYRHRLTTSDHAYSQAQEIRANDGLECIGW